MKTEDRVLEIGERIEVPHGTSYPYELLPSCAKFAHVRNEGNPYGGFSSILEVVED